jgi:hypothetical protein
MLNHVDGRITIQVGGLYAVDPTVHELEPYYNTEFKKRLGLFMTIGNGAVKVVGILSEKLIRVLPPNQPPGFILPLTIKSSAVYKAL